MTEIRDSRGRLCFTVAAVQMQRRWVVRIHSSLRCAKSIDCDCNDEDTARRVAAEFAQRLPEIIGRVEQELGPDWYEPA